MNAFLEGPNEKTGQIAEFGLRLDGRSLLNINFRAPFNNNYRASPGRFKAIYMLQPGGLFKLYLNLTGRFVKRPVR